MTVRFTVVLEGREYPVEVHEDLEVRIRDHVYRPEVREAAGAYRVQVNGREYEFRLEGRRLLRDGDPLPAAFRGYLHPSRGTTGPAAGTALAGEVRAPMPGRVVRVLAEEGERIPLGAPLLILEAMKMQNEIPAPREGEVREVRVEAGQAVARDDVLVVIG